MDGTHDEAINMMSCGCIQGFAGGTMVKIPPANVGDAGDSGSITGSGRSAGIGNGNPLQYSCLGNSTDRGGWRATVYGVAKSWTGLSMHTPMPENNRLPMDGLKPPLGTSKGDP